MTEPPKDKDKAFGIRLAQFREARRFSQKDLAKEAGCHHTMISKYETGRQPPKRPDDYVNLAKALGVSAEELLGIPTGSGVLENPGLVLRVRELSQKLAPAQIPGFFTVLDGLVDMVQAKPVAEAGNPAEPAEPNL